MAVRFCDGFEDDSALSVTTLATIANGGTIGTTAPKTGSGYIHHAVDTAATRWTFATGWAKYRWAGAVRLVSAHGTNRNLFDLRESDGTIHGTVSVNAGGALVVARGALGGTVLCTGTTSLALNTWYHVSFVYEVHDTTGVVEVAVSGALEASFSGDTRNGGTAGTVGTLRWGYDGTSSGSYSNMDLDDLVISDDAGTILTGRIPDCKVEADYPSGNGTNSGLTGSDGNSVDNYLLVDETGTPNAADYNGSPTPGTKDTYAMSDLATTVGTVYAVQVRNQMVKSDAGTIQGRNIVLSGGSTGTGADVAPTTTGAPKDTLFETNPNGPVQWTITTVNAMEPGFEVRT